MPIVIDDPKIERLIERLSTLRKLSETEVLYEAPRNELRRREHLPNLVEEGAALVRALHARVQRDANQSDQIFVEGLYEER